MSVEEEVLKGVLAVIENILNAHFQQKAWIEKNTTPYDFFEETMHRLFDDYELAEMVRNYKAYGISNEQYHLLNTFYEILDQYSDEKMSWLETVNPKEILADPKWHKIQKMAKKILKVFNYQKKLG